MKQSPFEFRIAALTFVVLRFLLAAWQAGACGWAVNEAGRSFSLNDLLQRYVAGNIL